MKCSTRASKSKCNSVKGPIEGASLSDLVREYQNTRETVLVWDEKISIPEAVFGDHDFSSVPQNLPDTFTSKQWNVFLNKVEC